MIKKVDLAMWTKDGERFLAKVLKRIDEVIPFENIGQKILVDDHSADNTVKIARDFNWSVYMNPATGIPSGANEALRRVETEFFVSLEQDILLEKDWWSKITPHFDDEKVACAQGIKLPTNETLRKLEEYVEARHLGAKEFVAIDNNIFRTNIVKGLGGFPTSCPICADTILMKTILNRTSCRWIIDKNIVSLHIRESVLHQIRHTYKQALLCAHSPYCSSVFSEIPPLDQLRFFITSPLRGLIVAVRKSEPNLTWAYPSIRFMWLRISLDRKKRAT